MKNNDKSDKVGKFFINELWSEKFHKQVLKETKIKEVCERIEYMHRKNISNLLEGEEILPKRVESEVV